MITLQDILPKIIEANQDKQILSLMYKKYKMSDPIGSLGIWSDSIENTHYIMQDPGVPATHIIKEYLGSQWSVGLSSRVVCVGGIHHIPMMDFQIPISPESEQLLYERIDEVLTLDNYPGGWLLQTTNSYHFIGSKIVDVQTWLRFVGRMLLLRLKDETVSVADDRYIGYSLCRLDTPLRCSPKGGVVPFVVREIRISKSL